MSVHGDRIAATASPGSDNALIEIKAGGTEFTTSYDRNTVADELKENSRKIDRYGLYAESPKAKITVEALNRDNTIKVVIPDSLGKQIGVYAANGTIDIKSDQGNNIVVSGINDIGEAIFATGSKGTVNLNAAQTNALSGAVVAQRGSVVNITGHSNTISSSYETPGSVWDDTANNNAGKVVENYPFVSAVRAGTDPNYNPANGQSTINISADGNNDGVLNISTSAEEKTDYNDIRFGALERAVWAYNGEINLNSEDNPAETHITTTFGSPHDTTRVGAALIAGNAGNYTGKINAWMGDKSSIYGDIVGAHGGTVNVKMGENSTIEGNIFAGNGNKDKDGNTVDGKVTVTLGANSKFTGRTDDYYTLNSDEDDGGFSEEHAQIFKNPAFSREIKSAGEITLNLGDNSTWDMTGQSWITNLNLGNNVTIDMRDNTMRDEKAENNGNYAISIGKISGEGTFELNLNAKDRNSSQMIYIKDADTKGKEHLTQTIKINYIEGLEKLIPDESGKAEIEKLRFSVVNSGYGEMASTDDGTWEKDGRTKITDKDKIIYKGVLGSNVIDYNDKGVLNRQLYLGKETYDTVHDKAENDLYNTGVSSQSGSQEESPASAASADNGAAAPKRVMARAMRAPLAAAGEPAAQADNSEQPADQADNGVTETKPGTTIINHGNGYSGVAHYATMDARYATGIVEVPQEPEPPVSTNPPAQQQPGASQPPQQQPTLSDQGRTIINMGRLNYEMGIYMDRLNKRLGEARFIDGEKGLWVRGQHTKLGRDNSFDWNSNMYQIGYESYDECDNKEGYHRKGIAFDYTKGDVSYSDIWGKGEGRRRGVWLYDTWFGNKGHYKDVVLKYGHLDNEFDYMTKTDYENVTGDYDNNAFALSFEWGYKDYHDSEEYRNRPIQPDEDRDEWYFEPQMQLQYTYMTGADYQTNQQINGGPMIHSNVDMDHVHSLIGRLGFRWGFDHHYYDENKEEVIAKKANYYIKADVLHEFLGDQDITVSDSTTGLRPLGLSYDHKGTWYDIGIGYTRMMDDNSYFFIDAEKIIGNHYDDSYQINVGMHWSF